MYALTFFLFYGLFYNSAPRFETGGGRAMGGTSFLPRGATPGFLEEFSCQPCHCFCFCTQYVRQAACLLLLLRIMIQCGQRTFHICNCNCIGVLLIIWFRWKNNHNTNDNGVSKINQVTSHHKLKKKKLTTNEFSSIFSLFYCCLIKINPSCIITNIKKFPVRF